MKKHLRRIDASLLCFALVVIAAIPVAALRSKTYSIGYELGRLKSEEKHLRQRNVELQSQLASVQRSVRESHLKNNQGGKQTQLNLPAKTNVWRPQSDSSQPERNTGEKDPQRP